MNNPSESEDKYLEERVDCSSSLILDHLSSKNRPLTIADMGCGDGRALNRMVIALSKAHLQINKIYAVDIEPNISNSQRIEVIKTDLNSKEIPLSSNSVDMIYSLETIEHLVNPATFVKEIHRILANFGIVVLTTPNLLAWYNRFLVTFGSMPIHYEVSEKKKYGRFIAKNGEVVHHIRVFSPRALSEMLEDNGFEVIKVKGLRFVFGKGSFLDSFFSNMPSFSSCFSIAAIRRD